MELIVEPDVFINACIDTLVQAGVPSAYAKLIVMMGTGSGGSAIHPHVLLWEDAVKFANYLQGGDNDVEEDLRYIREVAVCKR